LFNTEHLRNDTRYNEIKIWTYGVIPVTLSNSVKYSVTKASHSLSAIAEQLLVYFD